MVDKTVIVGRIRQILDERNLSINEASKLMNVAQTTLNPQLNNTASLNLNVVLSFLEAFPNISAEWLLRGEGVQFKLPAGNNTIINNAHASNGVAQVGTNGNIYNESSGSKEDIIAVKDDMIAELKKDKENLMMLLRAITAK